MGDSVGQLVQHESHSALALYYEFSVRLILDVFPRLMSYLVFKEPGHERDLLLVAPHSQLSPTPREPSNTIDRSARCQRPIGFEE